MEQELELEVKIISKETIKSSVPPSSPPKIFTLSLLDQNFPAFHVPVLFFFTNNPTQPQGQVDLLALKTSLTQALDQFYPLAGRFLDESTISCNNQGVPFIQTQVNSHLFTVLNSPHKLKLLTKFLPLQDLRAFGPRPISELISLVFQINVFFCGGVVIGCYMLHKLLDATSFSTFINHWAALASKRYNYLIQPDFESIVKSFPPLPRVQKAFVPDLVKDNDTSHPNIVAKSFVFSSLALNSLKAKAASELVPNPSRFEALAGFVWEQTLAAAYTATNVKVENTRLSFCVNMRPRMSKPLPKESMGNLITNVHPQGDARTSKIQDFVKEIHLELSAIKEKIRGVYEGENGGEALCEEMNSVLRGVMEYEPGIYRLTSWCKAGLNEADFGFGKPVWIIPTDAHEIPPTLRNFILFTDYSDGIEVWVFLEAKEMEVLESNPHFLAFGSPH